MLIKLKRPANDSTEGPLLATSEDGKLAFFVEQTDNLRALMGEDGECYVEARLDPCGDLVFGGRVDGQNW
jgi:hypothetical protein